MHEKEHVLTMLEQTKEAVIKEDVLKLKELSNQTIHSASVYQDTDSITLAVVIYSLSKIIERKDSWDGNKSEKFFKDLVSYLDKAIKDLSKDNEEMFIEDLGKIRTSMTSISGNLRRYVKDVFDKASINKASKIYEHGISMEQTAKLLGITIWELAGYTGQKSETSDLEYLKTYDVKSRVKLAMEFFK